MYPLVSCKTKVGREYIRIKRTTPSFHTSRTQLWSSLCKNKLVKQTERNKPRRDVRSAKTQISLPNIMQSDQGLLSLPYAMIL